MLNSDHLSALFPLKRSVSQGDQVAQKERCSGCGEIELDVREHDVLHPLELFQEVVEGIR